MRLVPTQLAFLTELAEFGPGLVPRPTSVTAAGWLSERAQREFQQWAVSDHVVSSHPVLDELSRVRKRLFARRRVQLVDDKRWYSSQIVQTLFRESMVDDTLTAMFRMKRDDAIIGFGLYRAQGDRPFGERERMMVSLLLSTLGPAYERATNGSHHGRSRAGSLEALPPRLAETLARLKAGMSEKQVARRMGLSQHTVHDYVKALHRRLNVSSRGELLAAAHRAGL